MGVLEQEENKEIIESSYKSVLFDEGSNTLFSSFSEFFRGRRGHLRQTTLHLLPPYKNNEKITLEKLPQEKYTKKRESQDNIIITTSYISVLLV